jgi:U3 small nucleolar RNA-associated protein 3
VSSAATIPEDPQTIVRHLKMTNPEALALARDWEDVAEDLIMAQQAIQKYGAPLSHIAKVDR